MRGQISVEYLVVIGFALGLLIPGIFFFYKYAQGTESQSVSVQVNEIGLEAVSTAKSTFALGKNARNSLEFVMPEKVTRVYVPPGSPKELVIAYDSQHGASEAVFFSAIPLATVNADGNVSTVHAGLTRYRFESRGSDVLVSEVTS